MENKINDMQTGSNHVYISKSKGIALPLIALGLDLIPVLIICASLLLRGMSAIILFLLVLSPAAGLVTGIVSLCRGKGRTGIAGKIIAVTAIVIPLAFVAFVVVIFIGAVTGVISLM